MKIDFANLKIQYRNYESKINAAVLKIFKNSNFIMGEEVYKLEKTTKFWGTKNAITCSSGTDAFIIIDGN